MNKLLYKVLLTLNMLAIIFLLMSGYSGYINPAHHSLWAMMGFLFPGVLLVNIAFLVVWALVKPGYVLLPVIGLCLAYWPIKTYIPLHESDEHPTDAIKVLSYNILAFNLSKAPQDQPNPIFRYIVESKADIVCMQEFCYCCRNDSLWPECEKIYQYRDTLLSMGKQNGDCIAIFSKYPIISKEHISIRTKGNTAGAFTVDIHGKHVCVINLHLETVGLSVEEKENFSEMVHGKKERDSLRYDSHNIISKVAHSSVVRASQADAVHDFIRRKLGEMRSISERNRIDGGVILCGDFNDHPLSYVHHTIADELTDCYTETALGTGFTMHYNSMYFRIDNILCSSNWQPYNCTVDKSVSLSDHYPIYCYLKLKKEQ